VFEGLFSPWHLLILAVVVFVLVSPRKVAARWHDLRDAGRRVTGELDNEGSDSGETPARRSVGYRLGRLLRRR
jgi:Sec-independent protein translocase protein TatA